MCALPDPSACSDVLASIEHDTGERLALDAPIPPPVLGEPRPFSGAGVTANVPSRFEPLSAAELAPWLAGHMDVNAIDLAGIAGNPELATSLEEAAAENLKRVRRAPNAEPDWTADPGIDAMTAYLETKTVWHPIGI